MTLEAKKNLALNIANSLMKGKFGNEESLIEEYMETYFEVLNHNEQQKQVELSKEEVYNLATNIANTLMVGKIGTAEDFIEEYMEFYMKGIAYNNVLFSKEQINEEIAHYLASNIANTYIAEKIGDSKELIEEYMDVYNKSYSYNANKIKEQPNYFYISTENDLLTKETTDEFNTRKSR